MTLRSGPWAATPGPKAFALDLLGGVPYAYAEGATEPPVLDKPAAMKITIDTASQDGVPAEVGSVNRFPGGDLRSMTVSRHVYYDSEEGCVMGLEQRRWVIADTRARGS